MDASTLVLANIAPNFTPAPASNLPVPAAKPGDTQANNNDADQVNFHDLIASNLKDDQANDAQAARDAGKAQARDDQQSAATREANSADKTAAAANKKTKGANAETSPGGSAATAVTPAVAAAIDPALGKQVAHLVNTLFGKTAGTGGQPVLNPAARKQLTKTIDTMLAGLPSGQRQAALTALQNSLTQGAGVSLTTTGAAVQAGAAALVAAGFTPQQLTDLANKLNNFMAAGTGVAKGDAALPGGSLPGSAAPGTALPGDDLTAATPPVEFALNGAAPVDTGDSNTGIDDTAFAADDMPALAISGTETGTTTLPVTISLTAPVLKRDPIFSLRTATTVAKTGPVAPSEAKTAGEISSPEPVTAKLNPLTAGAAPAGDSASASRAAHPFDNVLQIFSHNQNGGAATAAPTATGAGTSSVAAKSAATVAAAVAANMAAQATGTVTSSGQAAAQSYPDGSAAAAQAGALGLVQNGTAGMPINGGAMMTSLVNNAVAAGNPHPATQAVASAVLQAGEEGEDSNITVSLDPAELGKVQVRLQIGKDQSVKAHLLVEKPETYMMLQRDQHVLQKHLQDTGLDVSGGSLSFELAQGGMDFNQDGREGNASNGGTGASANSAGDTVGTVLETTMTWVVDPQSGRTHYNILA